MSLDKKVFNKNLNQEKKKTENILNQGQQHVNVISNDIIDQGKVLKKDELLNKQDVSLGLKPEEVEYFKEALDMDSYKEGIITFENLPAVRLIVEKNIMKKGPSGLNGCKNSWARTKWKRRQQKRIDAAKNLVTEHNKRLMAYQEYQSRQESDISTASMTLAGLYHKEEKRKQKLNGEGAEGELLENKPAVETVSVDSLLRSLNSNTANEALESINNRLANNAFGNLEEKLEDTLKQVDTILTNYELENPGNNIDGEARQLQTKVKDLAGGNATELSEMADLFRTVLLNSENPYNKVDDPDATQEALNQLRYAEISKNAKEVEKYALNLGIAVPEELSYIIQTDNNVLLKGNIDKFNPKSNVREAYVLLLSAASKVYYEALNRFAGYNVHDGMVKLHYSDDPDRTAKNFDILNMKMMAQIRNIRDMSSAYANEIRKNRLVINENTISAKDVQDRILKDNVEILQGLQPTGLEQEKKEEKKVVIPERPQEDYYREWEEVITKDIRGSVEVEEKDTQKAPWIIGQKEYADRVITIMKADPGCQKLTGDKLKRYLISLNDNLNHNLKQLTDELPKTSVGSKFCYLPKMRDEFIEKLKTEKFAVLLGESFFFRDLVRKNSIVDDLFDKPKYKAVKNRQREIMKAINSELKIDFYTNAMHLSSLWANETIQALLLDEPADKEEHIKLAEEQILNQKEDKDKKESKAGGILGYTVSRLLGKSDNYGVTDQAFKDALEKIKATVHDNIAVIDRKISLMGVCDSAKEELKCNIVKRLGGEYLLGYSSISQDIVEYTVDNMMVFDGNAASMQKTWERKFARTGLPKRLSNQIERLVAKEVNKDGKRNLYYLRPKGYKVSKKQKDKWEETNNRTNKIISSLKDLYSNHIKNFLKVYVKSEELRGSVSNHRTQYVDDKLKLTKKQWDEVESKFEELWFEKFKDSCINGEYSSKDAATKLNELKPAIVREIDKHLTNNFNMREKLGKEKDKTALREFQDTLMERDEFVEGLKNNAVVEQPTLVVNDDIVKHIFEDPTLKNILKNEDDRKIFNEALNEELSNENSGLHKNHSYLENVRSIEQLGNLSLIDYTQFFTDLKALLTVISDPSKVVRDESKPQKSDSKTPKLLLEDWRLSGRAGDDSLNVKKKLLKDFLAGGINDQIFEDNRTKYEKESEKATETDMLHFDAILATETSEEDTNVKFNYLNIVGKTVKQTTRMRKVSYAQKLWQRLKKGDEQQKYDTGEKMDRVKLFSEFINMFTIRLLDGKSPKEVKSNIDKLGKVFENLKIDEVKIPGEQTKWAVSEATKKAFIDLKYVDKKNFLTNRECGMLKAVKEIFDEIAKEDPSTEKIKIKDCIAEMFLFGYGKEYFNAGGAGEKVFLNSDDNQYYADIAKKSKQFFNNKNNIEQALKIYKVDEAEKDKIMEKLKPIIASIDDSLDPQSMADNKRRFGVTNCNGILLRLTDMYSPSEKNAEKNLEESKKQGELYKARRDYIDSYGSEKLKGKFRIVREFMFRDPETWRKIMTYSDSDFIDFVEEQNRIFGKGLDVFMSDDYRGSGPINEQYIMSKWEDFKNRGSWTLEQWRKDISTYHDAFMNAKIQKKSIRQILTAVQKKMVSEGIDPNESQGTILMKLSFILSADPCNFALLYDENAMFDAVKRVDGQYRKNMVDFDKTMMKIYVDSAAGKNVSDDPELDKLLKEAATIYNNGVVIEEKKRVMGSTAILRKMDQDSKQGKTITQDDLDYADFSLLMQIVKPSAFSSTSDKFMDTLGEKIKYYREAKGLERNKNIYSDRNVLETKDMVRLEIDVKKNEGKMLEKEFNEGLSDYREKRAALGSIGLVAYSANPKFGSKEISKAKDFVDKELGDDYGQADEDFIKGLLVERAIAFGKPEADKLKPILVAEKQRLLSLDAALRKDEAFADEDLLKKAIVFAFAQNPIRMKVSIDGTHEGDIEEIKEELKSRAEYIDIPRPKSEIARRDYDEFMEEMDIARFTMTKRKFKDICDRKRKYFELVDACVEKINESTKELKVQVGLFEYFKKDIYEAIKGETGKDELIKSVTEQMDKLIGKEVQGKNNLSADDIRKIALDYLPDSAKLMQQVSNESITAEEKIYSSTQFTRADIEKEIANSGRKDLIQLYNSMTVEEQKVFAIALTFPDIGLTENEQLSSNVALKDSKKEYDKEIELQEQLATYIYGQEFAPKIDYNVVMRRLMKTDRKTGYRRVSKTMFEKAYTYTKFCTMKKNEMRDKDFKKLSDGVLTGELGRSYSGMTAENTAVETALNSKKYYGPNNFKDFFMKFSDDDVKQDKKVADIAARFKKYNSVQMNMLFHVLQDRTAVDYTTAAGKKDSFLLKGVSFVNGERRQSIKDSFLHPDGMDKTFIAALNRSVNGGNNALMDRAAETLFSYQLRDDVDLTNKSIDAKDFADGALKRKTKVDWKLLERAMDLVEEIEKENLRIQLCRQTVEHTMDDDAPNKQAAALYQEMDETFREWNENNKDENAPKLDMGNYMDYFHDILCREAKKNPELAMPLVSAYAGLSDNERMLLIHALKHRDILDISTDNRFTTAIGMNENKYVNEVGRDQLADYYIEHLSVPGAKNILATTQYDLRDAMKSLVSTQISDATNVKGKKDYVSLMIGQKVLNWFYIGADRSTGIDWKLFANALKFVKRTEGERKLLVGNAEAYRSAGDIDKYGRFRYNYQYMRKNLYRSGYRLTRFIGRRIRAEVEGAIPGYGFGQRIMMMCLSPQMKNKMLKSGVVKPGVSKNMTTDILGYAGLGGVGVSATSAVLAFVSTAAQTGTAVAGEGIQQVSSALSGLYNIKHNITNIRGVDKPTENEAQLKEEGEKKRAKASKLQTKEQQIVTNDNKLNTEWILNEVAGAAAKSANLQDIMETATACVNVLSGSSFGIQAVTNYFVGGIRAAISETLHTARFIMSVCSDKVLMDKYFADEGPLGKEIRNLKEGNIQKIIDDQAYRDETGSRQIMKSAEIRKSHAEFMGKMSNAELFRKAYGFKDFSEQASYVGWNIVQTLLMSASPYATDPAQFMRASLLLAAIGCKDVIGKQDNDSAQKVYNKLMGQDIR